MSDDPEVAAEIRQLEHELQRRGWSSGVHYRSNHDLDVFAVVLLEMGWEIHSAKQGEVVCKKWVNPAWSVEVVLRTVCSVN